MVVLMYHCVYRDTPSDSGFQNNTAFKYKISENAFEEQVSLISNYLSKNHIKKESVVFSFDDGGSSFYYTIKPILEKYGFKGIFFIATEYISSKGFLTSIQIRELYEAGHIIGAHSHSHPERMDELSGSQIKDEWRISVNMLSDIIGASISDASIPNGFSSNLVIEMMEQNGIKNIYTSKPTTHISHYGGSNIIGRYAITDGMTNQDVLKIVSSSRRRTVIAFKYFLLSMAKYVLGNYYLKIRRMLLNHE